MNFKVGDILETDEFSNFWVKITKINKSVICGITVDITENGIKIYYNAMWFPNLRYPIKKFSEIYKKSNLTPLKFDFLMYLGESYSKENEFF